MWFLEEETSKTLEGCLHVAGRARTPMHSWEDFASGRKPSNTITRHPEGTVSIARSKPRVTLVHTTFQTVRCGYPRDHAEVARVFEMLSQFSKISFLECFRKRIKTSNDENG